MFAAVPPRVEVEFDTGTIVRWLQVGHLSHRMLLLPSKIEVLSWCDA